MKTKKTFEQVLEESGLTARWEAKGEARGRKEIINQLKNGKSAEELIREYESKNKGSK